jgi:hypothetical protein
MFDKRRFESELYMSHKISFGSHVNRSVILITPAIGPTPKRNYEIGY